MRLIGVAVAAVAAWWWIARRRGDGTQSPPSVATVAPVARTATPPSPEPRTSTDADVPRLNDTGRLDASAGWDDLDERPARAATRVPSDARTSSPGLPGDDAHGVPTWDRPV